MASVRDWLQARTLIDNPGRGLSTCRLAGASLAEAWRTLMLSQQHDCWIVPYNGKPDHTWADQMAAWTDNTIQRSDGIIQQSAHDLTGESGMAVPLQLRVFNTLGVVRTDLARVTLPENWPGTPVVRDAVGRKISSQVAANDGRRELIFAAEVPAMGYTTFQLDHTHKSIRHRPLISVAGNGRAVLETDLYRMELDPVHGGTIRSLVLKRQGNRQLVDAGGARRFNELRGFFFRAAKFFSTAANPATIEVLENGPVRARVRIRSQLASNAVTQVITLTQGQRRIDFSTRIDWHDRPGIGENFEQSGGFQPADDHKAFYDDRYKLLILFPVDLKVQQIYKNAPFDVTQSRDQLIRIF